MRFSALTSALIAVALVLPGKSLAQQGNQPAAPDAPQPQKKTSPKPNPPASPSSPDAPPGNDNAFPEAVSRDAAKAAQQDDKSSDKAPSGQQPSTGKPASSDSNPFPEDVSRSAAKDAGKDAAPATVPGSDAPAGVSSSQSNGSIEGPGGELPMQDPDRAQKDTDVANFYLKNGNYQGAFIRFQEASVKDPTNVAAIFGLAEAQRLMGKTADAVRNYQLYLDIVPNGPKAKESMKALKTLKAKK